MKTESLQQKTRPLHGSVREPDYLELERVAAWCKDNDMNADAYGECDELQQFEQRVADMVGQPSAAFMPSGTMAQQIAMRVWCDQAPDATSHIGLHPTSHLLLHEDYGFDRLHGLQAVIVGQSDRPMTVSDLEGVVEPITALIIELPTRENGGQLATWDQLVELTTAAKERGIAVHVDGARLWEAAAGYGRPLDDIGELFDSVYVSFYKGIGALPGSILAGPMDFVAQARIWQNRQGGNTYTQMANWASAAMRLDPQIAKMISYRDRAVEIAAALRSVTGIMLNPPVPQVNMFHVFVTGDQAALKTARDLVAETHDIWLFGGLQPTDLPDTWKFELAVGDAALELGTDEIVAAFEMLVAQPV